MDSPLKYKTFLLFGAPGSGKGTQGQILGRIPGLIHVACGEIFRDLRVGSSIGSVFLEYSSRGALVPDDVTIALWQEYVEGLIRMGRYDPAVDYLVLDGIPRNAAQARFLDHLLDVRRLYYLDCVDRELMNMRLKRRALHENRLDDASDSVIAHRLYVYEAETAPVLSHYPADKIKRIDTSRSPIAVLSDILTDMRSLTEELVVAQD